MEASTSKKNGYTGCLFIAAMFVLAAFVGDFISNNFSARTANASDACYMAQKFVREQIKAPSTAEFATCREPATVVTQRNRIWVVRSHVDAQNSFGAMLRNDYTAELIYYPATGSWTLVDLSLTYR